MNNAAIGRSAGSVNACPFQPICAMSSCSIGQPAWPHPVIANGKLYLRDQDVLLCYDVKSQ